MTRSNDLELETIELVGTFLFIWYSDVQYASILILWLTSWLSFVVSSVSLSLSHWYPGSGVVLDCIDS